MCSYWNKVDSLQLLLLNNANPFEMDKRGSSALNIAIEQNNVESVRLIRDFVQRKEAKCFKFKNGDQFDHIYSNANVRAKRGASLFKSPTYQSLNVSVNSFSVLKTSTFDESILINKYDESQHVYANEMENQFESEKSTSERKLSSELDMEELESIINDIIDKRLSKQPQRTAQQPKASNLNRETAASQNSIYSTVEVVNSRRSTAAESQPASSSSSQPTTTSSEAISVERPRNVANKSILKSDENNSNSNNNNQSHHQINLANIYEKFRHWVNKINVMVLNNEKFHYPYDVNGNEQPNVAVAAATNVPPFASIKKEAAANRRSTTSRHPPPLPMSSLRKRASSEKNIAMSQSETRRVAYGPRISTPMKPMSRQNVSSSRLANNESMMHTTRNVKESSFSTTLNDFMTDNIGKEFFNHVLGKNVGVYTFPS